MPNLTLGGFRLYYAPPGFPIFKKELASGYGTAVGIGDPVALLSDGTVAVLANGASGTTTDPYGVVTGCWYTRSGDSRPSPAIMIPASTTFTPTTVGSVQASYVEVCPAVPGVTFFEVDADDGTTATTVAAHLGLVGGNADTTTGTPDSVRGSTYALDISTAATTESEVWRIVDLVRYSSDDYTASRIKYIVTANHSGWPSAATNRVGI